MRKNVFIGGVFCAAMLLAGCGAGGSDVEPPQQESGAEEGAAGMRQPGNGAEEGAAGSQQPGSGWANMESGSGGNSDSEDGTPEGASMPETEDTRELTAGELRQFTDFVNRGDNYGFLLSQYAQVGEVDLGEVLYNGASMDVQPLSEEEQIAYEEMGYSIETDITRLSTGQIEDFLQAKAGIGLEDVAGGLDWTYLEQYDSYVFQHGDTNYCYFVCTGGRQTGELYEIRCKSGDSFFVSDCVVTLKKAGEDYRFVSNLFAENTDDTKIARKIEEQSFSVELNGWGSVEFVSLWPDILDSHMQDISFELWQDGGAVYTFPGVMEGNERVNDSFVQIDAAAFKDYDKDGYTDVIIICTYELLPWAGEEEQYQEVRIYKGDEGAFHYADEVSVMLNAEQCNQSIAQVLARIEEEEVAD